MVEVGDYIVIKESVIDTKVEQLYNQSKTKIAQRWDGYRNAGLQVIAVDEHFAVTVQDAQGNTFTISKRGYDVVR
jgi:hypothetical protein